MNTDKNSKAKNRVKALINLITRARAAFRAAKGKKKSVSLRCD